MPLIRESTIRKQGVRCEIGRIWSEPGQVDAQEDSLSQLLRTMQQQGWSLTGPTVYPDTNGATPETGVRAVLIGKLSRPAKN